ncbi:MAG: hypothetical protein HY515_00215 [Candidatus Aenigmarchaeota archaeon]|nr:hypothetical protein [Candidatus Aenigmarchaeota archaeon]
MCNDGSHSERRHFQDYLGASQTPGNGYRSAFSGFPQNYASLSDGSSYRSYRR